MFRRPIRVNTSPGFDSHFAVHDQVLRRSLPQGAVLLPSLLQPPVIVHPVTPSDELRQAGMILQARVKHCRWYCRPTSAVLNAGSGLGPRPCQAHRFSGGHPATSQVRRLMPVLGDLGSGLHGSSYRTLCRQRLEPTPNSPIGQLERFCSTKQGSLFTDDGDDLFVYRRARRPGDILSVKISESNDLAGGRANTKLDRQVSESAAVSALLGLMQQINTEDARIVPGSLVGARDEENLSKARVPRIEAQRSRL